MFKNRKKPLDSDLLNELNENLKALNKNILELNKSLSPPAGQQIKSNSQSGLSVAIIGVRGHGKKHITAFSKLKNCHVSYICDVDTKVGKQAVIDFESNYGYRPKFVQDFREMLKDPKVDCVAICTPHHWHALATILCLQAGKHVYVEKPITHSYSERFAVLEAVEKYGKIVQAGTQLRSNSSLEAAGKYMREGKLGTVELVHCIVHKDRPPVPVSNENKIPATVDYDLWCGPAPKTETTRSKFHYHWHWIWEFGNGALGNNGIHRIDAARIALDLKGVGECTLSVGGRYGSQDSGETPNNMLSLSKFGETWVLQDILGLSPKKFKGLENAVVFYGSEGTIVYKTGYAALVDENFKEISRFEGKQLNHYDNFLKSVTQKDQSMARGAIEEGIISSDLCHFGNISYRTGKNSTFKEVEQTFKSLNVPDIAFERLEAMRENLVENGVEESIIHGELLQLSDDPSVPIVGSKNATALLTANEREGFELPRT